MAHLLRLGALALLSATLATPALAQAGGTSGSGNTRLFGGSQGGDDKAANARSTNRDPDSSASSSPAGGPGVGKGAMGGSGGSGMGSTSSSDNSRSGGAAPRPQ